MLDGAVIATLITSFLSLLLALSKMWLDHKKEKRDRDSQEKITMMLQEAENDRTKTQIDANVVWKARVEWIQNVRRETVELLTTVNNYILSNDIETQKKNLQMVREKKELLILYFGPDRKSDVEIDILDNITNESKNEKIVELINRIYDGASVYFSICGMINDCHNEVIKCANCEKSSDMFESCEIIDSNNILSNEIYQRCEEHKKTNLQMENKYRCQNDEFIENLSKLTEVMRVYLKIEWNRAKERTSI